MPTIQNIILRLFALLFIFIWSAGLVSAQIDPQAEKGDGVFKDGGGSWGLTVGHAAIYYGYYAGTWSGQHRHTVIQASGPSYSLDIRPFDFTSAPPTFMGSDPASNYTEAGHGARNCCSHGTWDASANTMTLARRSAIITESIRLVGAGVTYPSFIIYPDLWDPTSLNPRTGGTPTAMRCDGLVEWVYEKVGFNTCNNASTFAYWGLQTVNYHAADWLSASVDTPYTTLQDNGSSYMIVAYDNSSTPTYVNIQNPDGTSGMYSSPYSAYKQIGTTYYQGVDFANHMESWKQFYYSGPGLPDLTISGSVGVSPTSVASGGTIQVTWTEKNKGTVASTPAHHTEICLSTSTYGTTYQIGYYGPQNTLGAGATYQYSQSIVVPTSIPAGNYYVTAFIDCNQEVSEGSHEDNNIGSSSPTMLTVSTVNCGTLQFASSTYSVNENGGSVQIYVSRTGGSYGAASVSYGTANGTATAGSDYTTASGTLSWADGDTTSKSFAVPIIDDSIYEGNETFTASLSGASGASLGSPTATTVTIIDNETPPDTTPPTVLINHPTGGQTFTALPITVDGTANDPGSPSSGVSLVEVQVNGTGGTWQTASGTTSWSALVSLSSGANTIYVRSKDGAGNYSIFASVNVTYNAASQVAVEWTGGQYDENTPSDGPYALGYRFRAEANIEVTQLGTYDQGGDGLTSAHTVAIWPVAGGTPLVSATIPNGTSASLLGHFRYVSVTPVTLVGNTEYVIGASGYVGGLEPAAQGAGGFYTSPSITWLGDRQVWTPSGELAFPSSEFGVYGFAFFGPDFQFATGTIATVSQPSISPNGGSYSGSVQVTLACSTSGALIYYTTDGSDPTTSSTSYQGPFTLTTSVPVKAKAFASGYNPSATASASFTVNPVYVSVTVQPSLSGRSFTVDGTTYTTAHSFSWVSGSSHPIATTSPQSGGTGIQYLWSGWSDGGAISHTVALTNGTTYTANFTTQYYLTMIAGTGGGVSPSSGWNNSGAVVPINAAASAGYQFSHWSGDETGNVNPFTVTMNGAKSITANFSSLGTFTNLDFESASFSPAPSGYEYEASSALPGWTAYIGTNSINSILWDDEYLDSPGIAIWDKNDFLNAQTPFEGGYTVALQADLGYDSFDNYGPLSVAIAQTGQIPSDAKSLRFLARGTGFDLRMGAQTLPWAILSSTSSFNVCGADVSALAGVSAEMKFTVYPSALSGPAENIVYLDAIEFSSTPLPPLGTVTTSSSPTGGGTTTGGGSYAIGQTATLAASAGTGYVFSKWTESASVVSTSSNWAFTVSSNRSLVANFVPATYTVTPSAGTNGSISPNTPQTITYGGSVAFTATPADGYVVDQWLVNGLTVADGVNYTLTHVAADTSVQVTFQVTPSETYTFLTLAGLARNSGTNNGTGSAARFNFPDGVAVDTDDNVYVADTDNHTIRKVTATGVVTTLAGLAGSSGTNDGTGSTARFYYPNGVAVDTNGNVYVADTASSTIRKVTTSGVVTTLAGLAGSSGDVNGTGSAARFYYPDGVAVDSAGNIYVADSSSTIRKVTPPGVVTTLAGLARSYGSTDGMGSVARFYAPKGVAVDSAGNIYVADSYNSTIRKGWSNATQPVTITWATPADIIYGTPLSATQSNATASVFGTSIPGTNVYSPALGTVLGAGNAQTLSVTFTPTDTTHYLPATTTVSINVLQAPLALTANNASRSYGGADPGFSATSSGFVNGDTAAVVSGTPNFTTTATASSPVGNYDIVPTLGTLSAANYQFTSFINGTLAVSPAGLMIRANNTNKVYGQTLEFTGTEFASSGLVNGDMVTNVTLTSGGGPASAQVSGSPYAIVADSALGAGLTNYAIAYENGTLTETRLGLTVHGIVATNKVYDGTTTAPLDTSSAALVGVLSMDTGNVTLVTSGATGEFADKNVGTDKFVTISGLTLSGSAAGNYTVIEPTTTANIVVNPVFNISSSILVGHQFNVTVSTVPGANYTLEFKNSLSDSNWTVAESLPGTGGAITLTDSSTTNHSRFYRVLVQ